MTLSKKVSAQKQLRATMKTTEYVMPETNRVEICPKCGARTVVEHSKNSDGDALQRAVCPTKHWTEAYGPKVDDAGGVGTMIVPQGAVEICRRYTELHKD